jgi:hypothetical protein
MKNLLITTTFILILTINISLSQEELPKPFILPDNPLYGLSRFFEKIRLLLTFDEESKFKLHLHFSELRLSEAKSMIEKGKAEFSEKLIKEYESEVKNAQEILMSRIALGKNVTDLAEHISNVTQKHIVILERVLEKVPEKAKIAIENAINVSISTHENVISRIRKVWKQEPDVIKCVEKCKSINMFGICRIAIHGEIASCLPGEIDVGETSDCFTPKGLLAYTKTCCCYSETKIIEGEKILNVTKGTGCFCKAPCQSMIPPELMDCRYFDKQPITHKYYCPGLCK